MRGHHWLIEENTIRWANALGMDIGRSEVDMDAPAVAGHHIVRRNRVEDCGVCGIAGTGPLRATLIEENVVSRCGWQNVEEYFESPVSRRTTTTARSSAAICSPT